MNPTTVLFLLAFLPSRMQLPAPTGDPSPLIAPAASACAAPVAEVACSLKWRAFEGGWDIASDCFSTCGTQCTQQTVNGYVGCSGCGDVCNGLYKVGSPTEPSCDPTIRCTRCATRVLDHTTWTVCTCP